MQAKDSVQFSSRSKRTGHTRRGVVVPFVAICLIMMLGFGALTIDSGRLYVAKNELQNAADAAALAAATAMVSEANQKKNTSEVDQQGYALADYFSKKHRCHNIDVSLLQADVAFGRLEKPNDLKDPFNPGATDYNAVRVTAQRSTASNGALDLSLSRIWGMNTTNVGATAVAVADDHMSGYQPPESRPGPLIPVTMPQSDWAEQTETGNDEFSYNPETGEVTPGPDGIPEVNVYPGLEGQNGQQAPGNFGLLNIGASNNSVHAVDDQIVHGVGRGHLKDEVGEPELIFYDDGGNPKSYLIGGTPGLKASLEKSLIERLGDIVGIPVNSGATGQGANSLFTITMIKFGRVMEVELQTGNKRFIVQPAFYSGSDIITSPEAPSTEMNASRIRLAR